MTSVLTGFRAEHHALQAHLDAMERVADEIGVSDVAAIRAGVDNVYDFLFRHLLPHARAEDQVMYPLVDELVGSGIATATMRRDHEEVVRLLNDFRDLRRALNEGSTDPALLRDLRKTLYALHTLVTLHFAKEDEYYLPIIEQHLDQPAADDVARRLEQATLLAAG